MEQGRETHKISLWVENDEGLYNMTRGCTDGDELENQFIDLCEHHREFAMQILLDLLGPVDWQDVWERVRNENLVTDSEEFDQETVDALMHWIFTAPDE